MAIALVGTSVAEAAATTGIQNSVPAGTLDNHFLCWITGQTTATLIATLAGWTQRQSGVSGASSLQLWYRTAASEPASYTTAARTASRAFGLMLAFSGVDLTTPWDVTEAAMAAGTTAVAAPAITPVTAGAWILALVDGLLASGVINTTISSTNLDAIDAQKTSTSGTATNMAGAAGHELWSGAGAFTPAWAFSNATTRTLAATLALRPAAGGGSTRLFRAEPPARRASLLRAANY